MPLAADALLNALLTSADAHHNPPQARHMPTESQPGNMARVTFYPDSGKYSLFVSKSGAATMTQTDDYPRLVSLFAPYGLSADTGWAPV